MISLLRGGGRKSATEKEDPKKVSTAGQTSGKAGGK